MSEENAFRFAEFAHPVAVKGKVRRNRILLLTVLALASLAYVLLTTVAIKLPQLIALLPLFIWIVLMFTWRYVSYECATRVEDGTLSFARLFGKSRRVLWSCRVSELLYAAPDTPEARAHAQALAPHAPLHDYTSGAAVPLRYLAVASVNEKLHLVRFDCYDELVRTLRFYNKSVLTK